MHIARINILKDFFNISIMNYVFFYYIFNICRGEITDDIEFSKFVIHSV